MRRETFAQRKLKILFLYLCSAFLASQGFGEANGIQYIGGEIKDVSLYRKSSDGSKTFAYVARGGFVHTYDITDITNPQKVDSRFIGMETIENLAIDGEILAASAGSKGTYIYSLERPEKPSLTKSISGYLGNKAFLYGQNLIVVESKKQRQGGPTSQYSLYIFFDISDPDRPENFYLFNHRSDNAIGKISFIPVFKQTNPLIIFGKHSGFMNTLKRYEIDRRDGEIAVTQSNLFSFENTIRFTNDRIGYVTHNDRFAAYNLAGATQHVEIASIPFERCTGPAFTDGAYAYQPIQNNQLAIIEIDLSNNITEIDRIDAPFIPQKVQYGIGYTIDKEGGVSFFDLNAPNKTGRIDNTVLNFSLCTSEENVLITAENHSSMDENYVTAYSSTVSLYSIADCRNPIKLDSFSSPDKTLELLVEGSLLLDVAPKQIFIYDISNPNRIEYQSTVDFSYSNSYSGPILINRCLYLHTNDRNWTCVSLENPKSPVRMHKVNLPWPAYVQIQRGDCMYVLADNSSDLFVVDASDPFSPKVNESFHSFQYGMSAKTSLHIDGNTLYASRYSWDEDNTIYVFDIREPTRPVLISKIETPLANTSWSSIAALGGNRRQLVVLGDNWYSYMQYPYSFRPIYRYDIGDFQNPKETFYSTTNVETNGQFVQVEDNLLVMTHPSGYYVIPLETEESSIPHWRAAP